MKNYQMLMLLVCFLTGSFSYGDDVVDRVTERLFPLDHYEGWSDPVLMRDIVENDFYLSGFPEALALVQPYLETPQSLWDFMGRIKQSIRSSHPAIVEVLQQVEEREVFPLMFSPAQYSLFIRTLHTMVLLEVLVKGMVRDFSFINGIRAHYLELREEALLLQGYFFSLAQIVHAPMEQMKLGDMDGLLDQYVDLITKREIDIEDLSDQNFSLQLNLAEATLSDTLCCNFSNAYLGRTLLRCPIQSVEKIPSTRCNILLQHFPHDKWSRLHQTWHLAYLIGTQDNLHLQLPQLLIPSVIGAFPDDYLFYRGLSGWVTTQLVSLHRLHHKESVMLPEEIKSPLAEIWGTVNARHAEKAGGPRWPSILPDLMRVWGKTLWRAL